jgi:outer membrane protein
MKKKPNQIMKKQQLLFISFSLCFNLCFSQTKKWTLKECVDYAIANNISIKQTTLDNQSAVIDKKTAYGNFMPTINGQAAHSWNIGLNQNITTGLLEDQTTQFTSAGLNANIDIYKGLQNQERLRRANLAIIANQFQLTKMKDDVALNVANAFLQILYNKEDLKIRLEQLAISEKQLTRTSELVKAGSIPKGDLLDMKATVASNKQTVIVAENALLISKLSLAQLLQLNDFKNFDIDEGIYSVNQSTAMQQTPASIFERVKQDRVELKIAKTNLDIAEKDIKIAKSAYQPTLSGYYSFSTRASNSEVVRDIQINAASPTTPIGFVEGTNQTVVQPNYTRILGGPDPIFEQFKTNKGQNFGFQLNIPIFNGFSVRNNVEKSKIALERSKIAYKQQELDLERTIYNVYNDAKGALNAYESAVVTSEARTEAYNYAKEKFAVGLMNAFDLNQSQTLFVNAQSDVIRTKYDYIFKIKVLEFYFGIPIRGSN